MNPAAPADPRAAPPPAPEADALPPSVAVLTLPGRTVYIVGTAHISAQSVADVRAVIAAVRPETVCVELCEPRRQALARAGAWRDLDIYQVVRRGQAGLLLVHLVLSAFQRKLGEKLGVTPGADMLAAIEAGEAAGARLVMADRNVQVTLKRTWALLGWWDKAKLLTELMAVLVVSPDISAEEVEALRERDMLSQVMEQFARAFPRAHGPLIAERDTVLAENIRAAPGRVIVAVVGAGHRAGIVERLQAGQAVDLAPLLAVPPPTLTARLMQWGVPAVVLGLVVWGFVAGSAHASWEMAKTWVLVTGTAAALGTALALPHPLTVLSAFVAAPLTTLHPLLAAGWVAGLVEAYLRRPKVRDFETLPQDVLTVRGFWRNGITRILLVVALANLGATLGTLIGIPLLTRLAGG
jgi:pheromone shutdown-related protein TraB